MAAAFKSGGHFFSGKAQQDRSHASFGQKSNMATEQNSQAKALSIANLPKGPAEKAFLRRQFERGKVEGVILLRQGEHS